MSHEKERSTATNRVDGLTNYSDVCAAHTTLRTRAALLPFEK